MLSDGIGPCTPTYFIIDRSSIKGRGQFNGCENPGVRLYLCVLILTRPPYPTTYDLSYTAIHDADIELTSVASTACLTVRTLISTRMTGLEVSPIQI
jgi:hypothetical protein